MSSSFLKVNVLRKVFLPMLSVLVLSLAAANVCGQTSGMTAGGKQDGADKMPFNEYKGAKIGMSSSEVRQKLGKPEQPNKTQETFNISDKENARVFYDGEGKVTTILITYMGKSDKVPTPEIIFGEKVEANADGTIYKMVRYADAGFWVAYSRTAGDDPFTMITIQKITANN